MNSLYDAFEVDAELERGGVWFDIISPEGKKIAAFCCRPAHPDLNPGYGRAQSEYLAKRRAMPADETIEGQTYLADIYAREVVVDWRGVTDREGNELACTPENVRRVLLDLKPLFMTLRNLAMDWIHYRVKLTEDIVGN